MAADGGSSSAATADRCPAVGHVSGQPIVILIGGNHSDPSPAQLAGTSGRSGNSGLWRLKGDLLQQEQLPAEYFNWNGTRAGQIDAPDPPGAYAIVRLIRAEHAKRPEAPIILVGNSWGGHTAWQVCQLLAGKPIKERLGTQHSIDSSTGRVNSSRTADDATPDTAAIETNQPPVRNNVVEVDLLILLDPSSFGRGKEPMPAALPDNVQRVVNYYTRNSFGWRGWIEDDRLTNVDLGDPANGFLVPGGGRYDSVFNWSAHVSAEWDEQIHAAIREQIRAVAQPLTEPESSTETTSDARR